MSNRMSLDAEIRSTVGTSGARAARNSGRLPGVLYGNNFDPIAISVDSRVIIKEMHQTGFFTRLFDLKIGDKVERAIARDIQVHPVTSVPLHIDFMRISGDQRITVFVPIEFINEEKSPGIKKGGILNIVMHEIELSCPAEHIPDHLTIDLTGLEIHDSVHLKDLKLPQNVSPLHPERDVTVATVVAPTKAKAETGEEATATIEAEKS